EFYIIGEVKALKGYEQLRGMSMEKKVTHRIITWYDSRLTEQKRLVIGTIAYNILFVENVNEENRKMILTTEQTDYGS
ncbi:MAG: phage head closure protein, partial [Candidatus Hodarchaeales archaeon]